MMEHGYSGVMEFGDIFKAMRSTEAALGDTISPELWKRTVEVTLDEWDRIADANPHKTRELGEILLDTKRRGMWEDAELEQAAQRQAQRPRRRRRDRRPTRARSDSSRPIARNISNRWR
jgi:cobalamin biosynthesis Mg chelatase CobN